MKQVYFGHAASDAAYADSLREVIRHGFTTCTPCSDLETADVVVVLVGARTYQSELLLRELNPAAGKALLIVKLAPEHIVPTALYALRPDFTTLEAFDAALAALLQRLGQGEAADKLPIDHVFVLMLENRSFDHVFGSRSGVDGIDERRFNEDAAGTKHYQVPLTAALARRYPFDPPHSADTVAEQLQGDNGGFVKAFAGAVPGLTPEDYGTVMGYQQPDSLPMVKMLADHFAISDRWFSPIPTGTIPNRLYAMCGQSFGARDNPGALRYVRGYRSDKTIFHKLDRRFAREQRPGWVCYSATTPPWMVMLRDLRDDLLRQRCKPLSALAKDLADEATAAALPPLVWLEPSYSWTENDLTDGEYAEPNCDHPPSDVLRGQALIEYVYDAVRNSKVWQRSALVIVYDEHGGFYDHVPPPACVPGTDGFVTRGPRVPAIVVSPLVEPGRVVRAPQGKVFDHTSVLKFLCEQFDLPRWTTRLQDPSTLSLREFFDPTRNTQAPDAGLGLGKQDCLRLDLQERNREPPNSLERLGMRFLRLALKIARRRAEADERYEELPEENVPFREEDLYEPTAGAQ
jgi:phospholipase C